MSAPEQPNPPSAPATGAATPTAAKTWRMGNYVIISKLGSGAMGAVYLARQDSTNLQVALKILPPDMAKDRELLERFRREARSGQRLSHPNVVATLDVGTVGDYNYIAMEFVDGKDLEALLKERGPFPSAELLKIAEEICSALESAEVIGMVHRDIKPANIMMNSQGAAKLSDMGLASAIGNDEKLTMAGCAVGTPYYISPEQACGDADIDVRADIYSLGATLYHLATGSVPFAGSNPIAVMTAHIQQPLMPPHERLAAVPRPLSFLIQSMMAKERKNRPQSARELHALIDGCKRGQAPVMRIPAKGAGTLVLRDEPTRAPAPPPATGSLKALVNRKLDSWLSFLPPAWRLAYAGVVLALVVIFVVSIVVMKLRNK